MSAARKSRVYAPGARVVIRDEEWIVRSTQMTSEGGNAVRVVGLSELVRGKEAIFLDEIDAVTVLAPEQTDLVHESSPQYRRSRLYLESLLRQSPPTDPKIYLGHQAAMDQAAYQLVPAAKALAQPRSRILIADAVGLGKTLEVGILLSELILRGRGDRILVVALKSILEQFQEELWARFTIPLVRLDSVGIQRVQARVPSNMNPFYSFDRVILSIDTLKKDARYRRYLERAHWDVIVIDECQHVAERSKGRGTRLSQRARLAQLLGRTCDSLILTSATPHDGRPESFASLMNLLEPTAVAETSDYTREDVKGLFVRRFKKDVAAESRDSFQDRRIHLERVPAGCEEDRVFDRLATATFRTVEGGGILFRTTLMKAFLSSPVACAATLRARMDQRDVQAHTEAAQHDLKVLGELLALVEAVRPERLTKLQTLFAWLEQLGYGKSAKPEKVVIFSERVDTVKFLEEQLASRFKVEIGVFYGTLEDVKQHALVKDFGTEGGRVRILLATDAASEGINLHFHCHRLVHFDVPWSLIRMEQRNGRIDRYGQRHVPDVRYLLTVPSNAEVKGDLRILERLVEKEQMAHKNLGDVAWLMNKHDTQEEEERVALGISRHERPEEVVPDEADFDPLAVILGEMDRDSEADPIAEAAKTGQMFSLYPDDLSFAREAFQELSGLESGRVDPPDWQSHLNGFILTIPEDLARRYQAMPPELKPQRGELKLTADRERVQKDLAKAREGEGRWPEWQYFWRLHPVAGWLNDRVMAHFNRHEAPVLRVRQGLPPGTSAWLFNGVLSNMRSQPVIVAWFAVVRRPGTADEVMPLEKLAATLGLGNGFANHGDPGEKVRERLRNGLPGAVEQARRHMLSLRKQRADALRPALLENEKQVGEWFRRIQQRVDERRERYRTSGGAVRSDQQKRLDAELAEAEKRMSDRLRWVEQGLTTVAEPYLKVAAVFTAEG